MKKKLIPILTVCVLVACGIFVLVNQKKTQDLNNPPVTNSTTKNNIKDKKTNKSDKVVKSNKNTDGTNKDTGNTEESSTSVKENDLPEWTEFKLSLNGKKINLPILYSDYEKTGYKIPDIREGDRYDSEQSIKNIPTINDKGETVYINLENRLSTEAKVYDCYVTGITISNEKTPSNYTLPENLKLGLSTDEVNDIIGEPTQYWQPNDDESTAVFIINDLYECNITFNKDGKVTEIMFNNNDE